MDSNLMKEIEKLMEKKLESEAGEKQLETKQLDEKIDSLLTNMMKKDVVNSKVPNSDEGIVDNVDGAESEIKPPLDEEITKLFKDLEMLKDESKDSQTV